MFTAEKWTAVGTDECTSACAAMGLKAVGVSNDGNESRFLCSAGHMSGYRSGYKTVGVPGCYAGVKLTNYACLCDYTEGYKFEWKAAPGLLQD